tara:strand:+ start:226 stop:1491 length:1266 start_codon:yes stop_codon:yes gene_type:complete
MDKELSLLEDWAVEQILDWKHQLEATQKATGKAPSDLKRALRFGNELVFNPEAYGDMLERARSQGMSAKEIIQEIRKVETNLLNSKKVLMSDWLHHRTAQRTGGDTFLYMKGDERRAAREILRGEGIYLGNVDENFISLPGVLHTKKTQGVEKQWLDRLPYDERTKLYLPPEQGGAGLVYAHQTGASSFTISGTAEKPWLMTPEEGAAHLRSSATFQRAETQAAEDVLRGSGFVEEVQKLSGGAGAYDDPNVTRLSYDLEDILPAFERLKNQGGTVTTNLGELVSQRYPFANRLIRPALGVAGLTAFGAISDTMAVRAAATTPRTDDMEQTSRDIAGVGGLLGLAALAPPLAPALGPAAGAFAVVDGAIQFRMARDERRTETQKIMDPDYRVQVVEGELFETGQLEKERRSDTSMLSGAFK